jgi:hypothetical protein
MVTNTELESHRPISSSRILILILFLGIALRLTGWGIIDTIFEDSTGYIKCAAEWKMNDYFQNNQQEPLHILAIRTVHNLFFFSDKSTELIDHFRWEFSAFASAILFSVLSIVLLYLIGRKVDSPAAGLWAAFFLAVLPFGIIYAIHGLTETTHIFFLLSSLYFVLIARPEHAFDFFLVGIWTFLGLLVRKDGVTIPATILVYLLIMKDLRFTRKAKLILAFVLGFICVVTTYFLIGGRFYWIKLFTSDMNWSDLFHKIMADSSAGNGLFLGTVWHLTGLQSVYLPWAGWIKLSGIVPAMLFLAFLAQPKRFSNNRMVWLFIIAFIFQFALVYAFTIKVGYFSTRYLYPASVVALIPAAIVLIRCIETIRVRRKLSTAFSPALMIACLFLIAYGWAMSQKCYRSRHPEIRSAASWIEINTPANSEIWVTDPRIGFYTNRRHFSVSTIFYRDVIYTFFDNHIKGAFCYLAVFSDEKETAEVSRRLASAEHDWEFTIIPLQNFKVKKKSVDIYRMVWKNIK